LKPKRRSVRSTRGLRAAGLNHSRLIQAEEQGQRPTAKEASKLEEQKDLHAPDEPPRKKRKGPKQPNPLSMKKKQAKPDTRQGQRSTTRTADGAGKQATSHAEHGSEITEKVGAGSVPAVSPLAEVWDAQSTRGHKRKRKRKASDHAEQTDRLERVHSDSD
jgi:U3 small nucleolar RNA-associated protein 23